MAALALGAQAAPAQLAPEVASADAVVATPEGVVAVAGDRVVLLSGSSSAAAVRAALTLPAPAAVVGRKGVALVVEGADPSRPLYPDLFQVLHPKTEEIGDVVAVVADGGALHLVRHRMRATADFVTCDGRGLARQAANAEGGWAVLGLVGGEAFGAVRTEVASSFADAALAAGQVPQPAGPGRVLVPVLNGLLLQDAELGVLWSVDDPGATVVGACVAHDGSAALAVRADGTAEVRAVADGWLLWRREGGAALADLLLAAGRLGPERAEEAAAKGATPSDVLHLTTFPEGWLVHWTSDPAGEQVQWLERIRCAGTACASEVVHANVLRDEATISGALTGTGPYALDEHAQLLRREARGWVRVE